MKPDLEFRNLQRNMREDIQTNLEVAHHIVIDNCKICNGTMVDPITNLRCQCVDEYYAVENLIYSGAPLEIIDVRKMHMTREYMSDFQYKRVQLALEAENIKIINRKRWLYVDLLLPYVLHFHDARQNGDSIIMFGDNGRGKTWAMLYLLSAITDSGYKAMYIILRDLIKYLNMAIYGVDGGNATALKAEAVEMLTLFKSVDLLLIDEASKLPTYTNNSLIQIEMLVKERIGNNLPVVFSTNHSPYEFLKYFGKQVMSAFIKHVYPLHLLIGPDLRRTLTKNKKTQSFDYLPPNTQFKVIGDSDDVDYSIDSPVPLREYKKLRRKYKRNPTKDELKYKEEPVLIPLEKVTGTRRKFKPPSQ